MTRTKLFLIVQAALCTVIAVLLAAGALSLYLDGAAKQAEGDLFYYMFTRERAGAKLLPVLPLIFCALGLTIAGVILGIKDEKAEKPARDEKLLRDLGSIRERAVHQDADQKTRILRTAVLVIARRTDEGHEIRIRDNGVGFDVQKAAAGSGTHIGIRNVRERIEKMCCGSIKISSRPEEGTEIVISIPAGVVPEPPETGRREDQGL